MTPTPFRVNVPQEKLDRIARKLELAEITYAPPGDMDWQDGVDVAYMAELRDHWLNRYDWRAEEDKLNAYPQYKATIDGIDIHFYHLPGAGADPYPVILTHGWPGSVVEFLEAMPLLAAQGFTVVVPSVPGYGFSGRPPGFIGPRFTANLWRKLMVDVLGYTRFGAQGGDLGAMVTMALGREHGDVTGAIHLNMAYHVPTGQPEGEALDWLQRIGARMGREGAYQMMHRTKPQTIGLALSDSPIGFAAWVIEKNRTWSDVRGNLESGFSKDQMITNIMTYLVNDAVTSAIWMYKGSADEEKDPRRVEVPTGFAEYPEEFVIPPPRSLVEQDFNLVRWTKMERGGHFAAWEQPEAFAADVASFFREWR